MEVLNVSVIGAVKEEEVKEKDAGTYDCEELVPEELFLGECFGGVIWCLCKKLRLNSTIIVFFLMNGSGSRWSSKLCPLPSLPPYGRFRRYALLPIHHRKKLDVETVGPVSSLCLCEVIHS